jgi:ubiquinone/menaquinone biosynthesis C-methylase UbiE
MTTLQRRLRKLRTTLSPISAALMHAIEPLRPDTTGVFANYKVRDLKAIDRRYDEMFRMHADVHEAALDSIVSCGCQSLVEVACGSGHLAKLAIAKGLTYTGIDISETATAVACIKNTDGDFINLPVIRLDALRDQAFDCVYNSSMLEHIGPYEEAIDAMWRLAKKRLVIMFYEGLSEDQSHLIRFYPYREGDTARVSGGFYGEKVARQNHAANGSPKIGYFLNRFSRPQMEAYARTLPGVSEVSIRHFNGPLFRTLVTVERL